MSVNAMEIWKSSQRMAGQIGSLLQVAKMLSHDQPEQFTDEVINLLHTDPLAKRSLFVEIDLLEAQLKELRAAVAAKSGE
jgi:hypothetical protein